MRRIVRAWIVVVSMSLGLVAVTAPASAEGEYRDAPSPEAFVELQYADFLDRSPDAAGLAFWADRLARGASAAEVIESLLATPEFADTLEPLARLYLASFERVPDRDGLWFWENRRRGGQSWRAISDHFVASPEFQATYGDLDDTAFVQRVYRNVLDRPADDGGLAFWVDRLERGMPRGDLIRSFSESAEFRDTTRGEVRTALLYIAMLRRTPDAGGLAYWSGRLGPGTSQQAAIEAMLGTPEYRDRVVRTFPARLPLTGEAARSAPDRPALVVKIDNHDRARPQIGLNDADIVFEELVEGAITRFAAVFHADPPATVGPIRSVRTTDLDLIEPLRSPLLAASGANPGVLAEIDRAPVVNVNALVAGSAYFRINGRNAPHNLVASTSSLFGADAGRTGRPIPLFSYRAVRAAPAGGVSSAGVDIDVGFTEVSYRWNGTGWVRSQNGTLHTDADGRAVAPPNVVVLETVYRQSAVDAESPEAITVGTGPVSVYTGGRRVTGTWSRTDASERIVLRDGSGDEIDLTPGRTWVMLAPPGTVTHR